MKSTRREIPGSAEFCPGCGDQFKQGETWRLETHPGLQSFDCEACGCHFAVNDRVEIEVDPEIEP